MKKPLKTRKDIDQLRRCDNASAWPEMEVVKLQPFNRDRIVENRLKGSQDETEKKLALEIAKNQLKDIRYLTKQALALRYPTTEGMLNPEVIAELKERANGGKPVHFLDAGPGSGNGIKLAQKLSANIIGHGLGLNYPDKSAPTPRGRLIRRHFESTVLRQKGKPDGFFDVIQDNLSTLHTHYAYKTEALQNMLNSLRPGGVLISYCAPKMYAEKGLADELERQGVTLQTRPGAVAMRVFRRKGNNEIDLTKLEKPPMKKYEPWNRIKL